jgi:hypothetical protein
LLRCPAPFRFTVRDLAVYGEGGEALVYEVTPRQAFGYGSEHRLRRCRL